jgi:NADH-quinone oxidoreductase subunit M
MFQDAEVYATLLNVLIFTPLVGAILILFLGSGLARNIALGVSSLSLVLGVLVYVGYLQFGNGEVIVDRFAFQTTLDWFSSRYDIKYMVGVDGISIYLVLLATLLAPLAILFSFGAVKTNEKSYYALMLLLLTGLIGVFCALDLVLFFVFFELGLIPMFFLMGIWGGLDRQYAANKFFVYTLAGSVLLMIGILYVGFVAGPADSRLFTSDLTRIHLTTLSSAESKWLFWAFAVAFTIKLPLFPFHTWQPTAYAEAPSGATVLMAGVMGKMGAYGLIRFAIPLFPQAAAEYAWVFATLGVVAILYGGLVAMVQTNLKRLIAYSSVAHMGFVVLGIFAFSAESLSGAVLQLFSHGVTTGALFLLLGMLQQRTDTMEIIDYQGIAKVLPTFTLIFIISSLASVGLPGLNGFVGEFLILLGAFHSPAFGSVFAVLAATGVIIAAVYMLWMIRRVFFGTAPEGLALADLNAREVAALLPLVILMFWVGFNATPFLETISGTTDFLVQGIQDSVINGLATTYP